MCVCVVAAWTVCAGGSGCVWFVFLVGGFDDGVDGLFQLRSFLSRPLFSPAHLHAFNAPHSSPSIVGGVNCGPLLLGHTVLIIRLRFGWRRWRGLFYHQGAAKGPKPPHEQQRDEKTQNQQTHQQNSTVKTLCCSDVHRTSDIG